MKGLRVVMCTGLFAALAFAPAVQAGINEAYLFVGCDDEAYFCDAGTLYEVEVNCMNLEDGVAGGLEVFPEELFEGSGLWEFSVQQGTDLVETEVCNAYGVYGDLLKTEMKCTDAPKGSNKPHPIHGGGYAEANFEIKRIEENAEVCQEPE